MKRTSTQLRLASVVGALGRLPALTAQEAEGLRLLARTFRDDAEWLATFIEVGCAVCVLCALCASCVVC